MNPGVRGKQQRIRGFTLVEIMIALAIFAIVSAALIRNASMTVYQTAMIQEKTLAWWVAENEITELRSVPRDEKNYPSVGRQSKNVRLGDIDWEMQIDIKSTENENMRRVEVMVFQEQDLDNPVVTLSGFIGKH